MENENVAAMIINGEIIIGVKLENGEIKAYSLGEFDKISKKIDKGEIKILDMTKQDIEILRSKLNGK